MNKQKYTYKSPNCLINKDLHSPMTYMMNTNMENMIKFGSHAKDLGLYSEQGQKYMSDYCAKNWNSVCEIVSNDFTNVPDYLNLMNINNNDKNSYSVLLIRNVICKLFFRPEFSNSIVRKQLFDTLNPDAGFVTFIDKQGTGTVRLAPTLNQLKNLDNITVFEKVLLNPKAYIKELLNIFFTINSFIKDKNYRSILQNTNLNKKIFSSNWFKNYINHA